MRAHLLFAIELEITWINLVKEEEKKKKKKRRKRKLDAWSKV